LFADIACSGCYQGWQLEPGGGHADFNGKVFMDALNSETYVPTGSVIVPTEWTVMSSICDATNFPPEGVPWATAMQFPSLPGSSLGVHKIVYDATSKGVSCSQGSSTYFSYAHGDYLTDTQYTTTDLAFTCDNCSAPSTSGADFPIPIAIV